MRIIQALFISAAMIAPAAVATAQTVPAPTVPAPTVPAQTVPAPTVALPGTAPEFALTPEAIAALLEQCRAGNCAAGVQSIIAQARAAGITDAQLSAIVSTVAATLIEAARTDPVLAAQVADAIETVAEDFGDEFPALAAVLAEVATQVAAGNLDAIDLTAVAQAAADIADAAETEEIEEAIEPPTGGDTGSPA